MSYSLSYSFPKTRYQGSKYKLLPFIKDNTSSLNFDTVLDLFSGTSSVSYLFKSLGKTVYSNDFMPCNYHISKALIENNSVLLSQEDIHFLQTKHSHIPYKNFIANNFENIYYTNSENEWLDLIIQNILSLDNEYKKSLALWALYQSCLIKRPYNLFHRKNLHIRLADVPRTFGNKTTWDKPFEHYFLQFIKEANQAVFDNQKSNFSLCFDSLEYSSIAPPIDLVYIDPPYIPSKGSITTYQEFYHFLNGITDYHNWSTHINYDSKNLSFHKQYSIWEDRKNILSGFETLINNFQKSTLVISYRNDGIPTIEELLLLLKIHYNNVIIHKADHQYALSKKTTQEILIIAQH